MVGVAVSPVGVVVSPGGHPPEFFATRIVGRLISISVGAPDPIRLQAEAFRDQMFQVVLEGIRSAIESDRASRRGDDGVHR